MTKPQAIIIRASFVLEKVNEENDIVDVAEEIGDNLQNDLESTLFSSLEEGERIRDFKCNVSVVEEGSMYDKR